ncbi:MAG TPA: hypothetical protein VMS55_14085 [Myxococcota bacterium]|nr:hypothetical protein [Myxococcota bacterium]
MRDTPRRRAALWLFAALLGVASALFDQRGVSPEFRSADAVEYALMARRLAHGEGFTTNLIYPPALWLGLESAPAVKYAPLWPLVLAGPFAAFGADPAVARGVLVALFAALVATSAALAAARGGLVAGALAAVAVALLPETRLLALDAVSETLFALTIALTLLAFARSASPFAVGVCAGLAYLTRYNGAVLLPVLLALLLARERGRPRAALACLTGFLAVTTPWWIRNLVVTGSPFYTLLELNVWVSPDPTPLGGSLFFQTEPGRDTAAAADPLAKLARQLPFLLSRLPFASANLAAFAGVLLGCLHRDLLCLVFGAIGAATLVAVALALPQGRYLAPLLPAMIALGSAAWMRHGGRLRIPALALMLLAPALPRVPAELPDLALLRGAWEAERAAGPAAPSRETPAALRACLAGHPVVIAETAPRLAFDTDAIVIFSPLSPPEFWRIVEAQPVAFAQRRGAGNLSPERFGEEFAQRPDCGPGLYERRARPATSTEP